MHAPGGNWSIKKIAQFHIISTPVLFTFDLGEDEWPMDRLKETSREYWAIENASLKKTSDCDTSPAEPLHTIR
jgi:hypothetical protein